MRYSIVTAALLLLYCSASAIGSDGLARPVLSGTENLVTSGSGRFLVHWTSSGQDSTDVAYVGNVAFNADSCWAAICDEMEFFVPPPDQGAGGCDRYDIYLMGLSAGSDGYVSCAGEYQPPDSSHSCSASYMVLTTSLPSPASTRCPLANLFAQAVGASYDYEEPVTFLACFAAWMEEQVFPDGDRYLEYLQLPNPLSDPWKSFGTLGSADFPWMWMVQEKWGTSAVRSVWEYCAEEAGANSFAAVQSMLSDQGCSFEEFFMEYGAWRWFTGSNWFAGCGMYGSDAALWLPGPEVLPDHEVSALPFSGGYVAGFQPEENALNWIRVDLSSCQNQWVEFSFDGSDNTPWRIGVVLQETSGDLYWSWHECELYTGTGTVAVNAGSWDHAIFYPVPFDEISPGNFYTFTVSSLGTGVSEPEPELYLDFSVNPAVGAADVSWSAPAGVPSRVMVYSLGGRLVEMWDLEGASSGSLQLNGSTLVPGTYFVVLESAGASLGRRLVFLR